MFDSPLERHQGRKKSPLTWWLVAVTVTVVFGFAYYVTFGPNPPIRVSKATTHITTPLTSKGLPDYAAILREKRSEGVTPDNNGAIPFLQAMWPRDEQGDQFLSPESAAVVLRELGMPNSPPADERLVPLSAIETRLALVKWIKQSSQRGELSNSIAKTLNDRAGIEETSLLAMPDADLADLAPVRELIYNCDPVGRPWRRSDLPFLADWLESNREQIELLVEATQRSSWYLPTPTLVRGGTGSLLDLDMDYYAVYRRAARVLQTQIMLSRGEKRPDEAVRSAIALHRLSQHIANRPYLVDLLVAVAIEGISNAMVDQLACDPAMTGSLLRRLLAEVKTSQCESGFVEAYTTGERYFILDEVLAVAEAPEQSGDWFDSPWLARTRVDWNPVLVRLNGYCDEIVNAYSLPSYPARKSAFDAIIARYPEEESEPAITMSRAAAWLSLDSRSRVLADAMANTILPPTESIFRVGTRCRIKHSLTTTGVALAIFRIEQGSYPETLEELVPKVVPQVPLDPVSGQPLAYRRTEDGYLLYSVGPNGIDDGGSNAGSERGGWGNPMFEGIEIDTFFDETSDTLTAEEQAAYDLIEEIPAGADDISLRVPLPVEPWPWEQ